MILFYIKKLEITS